MHKYKGNSADYFKTLNKSLNEVELKYKSDCKTVGKCSNCLLIGQFSVLAAPYSFWLHLIAFLLNLPDFIPVLADSVQVMLIAFR